MIYQLIFKTCGFQKAKLRDLLHLIENMFDRKCIYANPSAYPNPNPEAQYCFRTDEMTSLFDQV